MKAIQDMTIDELKIAAKRWHGAYNPYAVALEDRYYASLPRRAKAPEPKPVADLTPEEADKILGM